MTNCLYLDLKGTPCPLNLIRCCLAIEEMSPHQKVKVDLDKGEPEDMVVSGLRNKGHQVEVFDEGFEFVSLMVTCGEK